MKKILVVDDSESIREQLRKDLESQQYHVSVAEDGEVGLKTALQIPNLDLIISDVNMPNMNGLDMCRKLHSAEVNLKIPILMMTTESSAELKAMGKELGVVAWITKPYNLEKLSQFLTKFFSRG